MPRKTWGDYVYLLKKAGCKCDLPKIIFRLKAGPRCAKCKTQVKLFKK